MSVVTETLGNVSVFASDRRSDERIDVAIWTRIKLSDQSEFPARITNISRIGLMAMTPCEINDGVRLELEIPEIGWISGELQWRLGDRMGIAFRRELAPQAFMLLAPFCL